jgi:hypothetical protein
VSGEEKAHFDPPTSTPRPAPRKSARFADFGKSA